MGQRNFIALNSRFTSSMRSFARDRLSAVLLAAALSFTTAMLAPAPARAAGGPFGLGIAIGDPSAITAKYWLSGREAADFGLSFNLDRYVLFYGDYLLHWPGVFGRSEARFLTPYLGIGGVLVFSSYGDRHARSDKYWRSDSDASFALGVRIPFGLEWRPATAPIGVFLELAPGLAVIPATTGFFQGAIGVRYYF